MRVALLALPAALVLGACGGGDDPLAAPPPVVANPTTTPTPLPVPSASAADLRLAAAGVLTPADLPGWTSVARSFGEGDQNREEARHACMKLSPTPYLARDNGRAFDKSGVEISSNADVAVNVELATAEMAALRGVDGPRCFREPVVASGGDIVIEVVPATVPGADEVVAYRVTLRSTLPGDAKSISGFQVVARVGQTLIWQSTYEQVATPTYALSQLTVLTDLAARRVRDPFAPRPTATPSLTPTPTPTASTSPSPTLAPSPTAS